MSIELTDAECDAFRALPLDFNGMVRAIYAAGAARSADTSADHFRAITKMVPVADAGALRPDENSPSGPSDRALNPQPEAVDHDRDTGAAYAVHPE